MTASHVLCFNCIWMELNLRWMMLTIRSISFGEIGRVRLCSRSRFITWVVNSLHAWDGKKSKRSPRIGRSFDGVKDSTGTTLLRKGTQVEASVAGALSGRPRARVCWLSRKREISPICQAESMRDSKETHLRKAGANFFALRYHGWSWGSPRTHVKLVFLDGTVEAINVSEEDHEPFDPLSFLQLSQLDPSTTCPAEPRVFHRHSSQIDTALLRAVSTSVKK